MASAIAWGGSPPQTSSAEISAAIVRCSTPSHLRLSFFISTSVPQNANDWRQRSKRSLCLVQVVSRMPSWHGSTNGHERQPVHSPTTLARRRYRRDLSQSAKLPTRGAESASFWEFCTVFSVAVWKGTCKHAPRPAKTRGMKSCGGRTCLKNRAKVEILGTFGTSFWQSEACAISARSPQSNCHNPRVLACHVTALRSGSARVRRGRIITGTPWKDPTTRYRTSRSGEGHKHKCNVRTLSRRECARFRPHFALGLIFDFSANSTFPSLA